MIMDLHNHTTFSYDGSDSPEQIIENAIRHRVDVVAITDHQFSLGNRLNEYKQKLGECKIKYAPYIKVLTGLEIGTRPYPQDFMASDADDLDFVLFESLDDYRAMDFFDFLARRRSFTCPTCLAHCDIFAMNERYGIDMLRILKQENIFWEINTSGNYNCYYDFLTNASKRTAVQKSKIGVSIGSDTHCCFEYRHKQLIRANNLAEQLGLPLPFMI